MLKKLSIALVLAGALFLIMGLAFILRGAQP
ncbi:protein of unknown function [Kyrpidia spormannii]|uniref:Uncharacterized protein n=2 Tax=Kyrpidia spormannii TaxID=2055160 RepID=A0ACA8ZCC6_9BACL|nr:protein of unknown function [Kyrpidia spormannii]CAB3392633.1 protein of unknown function [Kyrpidia spormannii]